jgi:hypothetical protein
MNERKLMDLKLKAVAAAKDSADKIGVGRDRARVIFDAIWDVVEPVLANWPYDKAHAPLPIGSPIQLSENPPI